MCRRRRLTYVRAMTTSSRRRFRTAADWTRLIKSWEASGLGAQRFAEGRDFSASSLYLWRKRLRAGTPPGRPSPRGGVDFVPVVVEDEARSHGDGPTRWELETASGLALTMSGPDAVRGLEVALQFLADEGVG